jgi:hypothetical protein
MRCTFAGGFALVVDLRTTPCRTAQRVAAPLASADLRSRKTRPGADDKRVPREEHLIP